MQVVHLGDPDTNKVLEWLAKQGFNPRIEETDVTDVSLTTDTVVSYHFEDPRHAMLFSLRWEEKSKW